MSRRCFFRTGLLRTGPAVLVVSIFLSGTSQDQRFQPNNAAHPTFSPDGRWIAFDANVGGNTDIYLVRPNGTDLRRLTTDPSQEVGPQWDADGTMLYYFQVTGGHAQVWRIHIASGRIFPTDFPAHERVVPRWSPDGKRVVLVDEFEAKQIVFLGGLQQPVVPYLRVDERYARPLWAPDGQSFAVSIDRDGVRNVYLHDLRTRTTREIVRSPGRDLPMGFSPSGDTLLFHSDRSGGVYQVYTVEVSTGRENQLTTGPAQNGAPTWSPDGGVIVFESNRTGQTLLYAMQPDGGDVRPLFPAWR